MHSVWVVCTSTRGHRFATGLSTGDTLITPQGTGQSGAAAAASGDLRAPPLLCRDETGHANGLARGAVDEDISTAFISGTVTEHYLEGGSNSVLARLPAAMVLISPGDGCPTQSTNSTTAVVRKCAWRGQPASTISADSTSPTSSPQRAKPGRRPTPTATSSSVADIHSGAVGRAVYVGVDPYSVARELRLASV